MPYRNDIDDWLTVASIESLTNKTRRYLQTLPDLKQFFSHTESDFANLGLKPAEIKAIRAVDRSQIDKTIKYAEQNKYHLITIRDDAYPTLLKEISDPPLVLYAKGEMDLLSTPQIAMVGSRHPSPTGYETAFHLAKDLAKAGMTVTSGLAAGIDAASHKGALATGKTIAVMGTGLNQIYPATHQSLAAEIAEKGLLLTDLPLNAPPKAAHFPRRNRLISGLSLGTLVVEATLRSGSLITARFAMEQNREVFAVPSSIHNPMGKGTHHLIRQGAKLVEQVSDLLEELNQFFTPKTRQGEQKSMQPGALCQKSRCLLAKIGYEPTSIDTIIVRSGLTAAEVSSILLTLELSGRIISGPGGYELCSKK